MCIDLLTAVLNKSRLSLVKWTGAPGLFENFSWDGVDP